LFFFIVQSLPVQLAQAKNGDQQFGKRKIHVGNGSGESCTKSGLILFSFEFRGGKEDFFSFLCSEHVHFMFFSSSQWVPIRFRMCSPKVFPIAVHFNPICFKQSRRLFTYISG
jgi:hypothetical protein